MNSEFVSPRSVDQAPTVPLIAERPKQELYVAASVTVSATGGREMNGNVSADPGMAVIVVALVALGVVAMSLYVVQLVIKAKKL